jgi:ABC-2 type transport system permease protein
MLNFIKSEYYRMIHTTGIRVFFGILSVLTILLISGISIVETQYHTTSFSYSILVSSPMFFTLMGMLTASVLYEDSKRNGIIKNSIANGIPRGKVFFSQCIVSITTATVIMTIVLTLWIFMTELFLDKTGPYDRSANGNSGYLFDCRIQYCFNNRTLPVFSKRRIHIFYMAFCLFHFSDNFT